MELKQKNTINSILILLIEQCQIFINQQDWKIQRNIDFETKKIVIIIINIIVTKGSCITNFNS